MEQVREALTQDRNWPRDLTGAEMTERYIGERTAKLAELKQVVTKALAEPND